jgi:hypothetical protein
MIEYICTNIKKTWLFIYEKLTELTEEEKEYQRYIEA